MSLSHPGEYERSSACQPILNAKPKLPESRLQLDAIGTQVVPRQFVGATGWQHVPFRLE
jgi:hypothetical protein